ncbi:glycerophosphodiester phosphodiesterase [Bifidobacterium leontopitheci]|uniref:Glycerophosphoryl diesterphosphodiesterase n=1 Tax=Bifidobacterium leontopitheci TaxID=2650774 RepID=A0A6I1GE05_9BIFI|nr:glycerophosphodiester phosphodiesterase [Bifidobacterium leontopitheci]KAB7789765.1 glycerophosphoryl diesterphosphodiesterase [Bifidobacterium leontopitheci]
MGEGRLILVDTDMFGRTAADKTAEANEVAKRFGIGDQALAGVEQYKAELTRHDAWDLPFMGYVNEDGYGYAFVPDHAVSRSGWDAYRAFRALPHDVQVAFAIRMLFTHRDVDRYGANMFLHYECGFIVRFVGDGANSW